MDERRIHKKKEEALQGKKRMDKERKTDKQLEKAVEGRKRMCTGEQYTETCFSFLGFTRREV